MCPWYILPRRRQGSRGRGLPSGLGWLVGRSGAGSAMLALRGAPGPPATGCRRARGRRGERRAAELSSTRVLSARGHGDAGPGSPRAQCCSPRLSNSLILLPALLGAHEAAASPPAPVPDASPLQPPPQLPSAGRAPPSGPRRRLELLARRARSREAGGGRAAPASALPARAPLAFPGGLEKAVCPESGLSLEPRTFRSLCG